MVNGHAPVNGFAGFNCLYHKIYDQFRVGKTNGERKQWAVHRKSKLKI
jgi:hypothetical protein